MPRLDRPPLDIRQKFELLPLGDQPFFLARLVTKLLCQVRNANL